MRQQHRTVAVALLALFLAGESSAQKLVPSPPPGDLEQYYQWIWFTPDGMGYVASREALLRTRDRGATWVPVRETFREGKPGVRELFFVNESTFFVFGWAGFWRTRDGGASFERFARVVPAIDDPTGHDELREGFFFLDANRGWALGDRQLLITKDGGKTWMQRRLRTRDFGSRKPSRLWLFDAQHAIAVGADQLFRTEDEGIHWTAVANSPQMDEVQCASQSFCAGRRVRREAVIYMSTDGGQSWLPEPTGVDRDRDRIAAFQAVAANAVVLVGSHNDQGRSERAVHSRTPVPTWPPDRGLLIRWDGNAWKRREYPELKELHAIHFVSATEAWASADFNGILHSTDGAQTWTFVPDYYRQAAARTPAPTPLFIVTPPPTP
jgi:photosystem II stability/assembly factor-like uncharacterized protein